MRMKRITAIAMAACLSVCLASPAFAAEGESKGYEYTVKVSAGASGDITKGETTTPVGYNETYNPEEEVTVTPKEGYYLKGFHIAGQDLVKHGGWTITEDTTLVASYGISGEQKLITYTIHYQAEDGTTLAEDRTYSGLEGDKPVVAYQVIDGYLPRDTYNVTWTLSADRTNEYTFVYVPATTVTTTTTTTTTTVTTPAEGTAAAGTAAGTAGAAGTATGAAGGAAAGGAAAGDAGAAGPVELTDLDEGDVPLAGVDGADGENGDGTGAADDETTINDDQTPLAGMSTAAKAGIGVIIAAAIVAIIAALAVRARKKKQEDETV